LETLPSLLNNNITKSTFQSIITSKFASKKVKQINDFTKAGLISFASATSYTIDGNTIISYIASGGYGSVWRVRTRSGKEVCMKLQNPCSMKNVKNEITIIEKLKHSCKKDFICMKSNYVQLAESSCYYLMNCIDGEPISQTLYQGLNNQTKSYVLYELARKVALLHRLGISHNDLKEDNILFDVSTNETHIIDFGLALQTGSGFLRMGTFQYSSPENSFIYNYDNDSVIAPIADYMKTRKFDDILNAITTLTIPPTGRSKITNKAIYTIKTLHSISKNLKSKNYTNKKIYKLVGSYYSRSLRNFIARDNAYIKIDAVLEKHPEFTEDRKDEYKSQELKKIKWIEDPYKSPDYDRTQRQVRNLYANDVWCLGLVFSEMIYGYNPLRKYSEIQGMPFGLINFDLFQHWNKLSNSVLTRTVTGKYAGVIKGMLAPLKYRLTMPQVVKMLGAFLHKHKYVI
jgi:serine/threonine protein kinase